jgi:hypothetical protein
VLRESNTVGGRRGWLSDGLEGTDLCVTKRLGKTLFSLLFFNWIIILFSGPFMFIDIKSIGKFMRYPQITFKTSGCNGSINLSKTYHDTFVDGTRSGIRVVTPYVETTSVRPSVT